METLRLLPAAPEGTGHAGEIYSCAFAPDGTWILTAGWDGHLRLWSAETGELLGDVVAGPKPLSACAICPDGQHWLAGSMNGLLSVWDGQTKTREAEFLAHTRPISAICYAPGGQMLATAAWDCQIALRKAGKEREGRILAGHRDIIAGCCFTADGKRLLSWSHDRTVRVWDLDFYTEVGSLKGHEDRVTAGAVAPDGRWAVTGGRDCMVRLWNLSMGVEAGSWPQNSEVRGCFFLPDAASFVSVDAEGNVFLLSAPALELQANLHTGLKVVSADLAPTGLQLALGAEDGRLYRVAVEGAARGSLLVTATQTLKPSTSLLNRVLGRSRMVMTYEITCPVCRRSIESPTLPVTDFACASCNRLLRVASQVMQPANT